MPRANNRSASPAPESSASLSRCLPVVVDGLRTGETARADDQARVCAELVAQPLHPCQLGRPAAVQQLGHLPACRGGACAARSVRAGARPGRSAPAAAARPTPGPSRDRRSARPHCQPATQTELGLSLRSERDPTPRETAGSLGALVGQDDVAVALEQRALVGECLQELEVVEGDGSKCRRQLLCSRLHPRKVPLEVDGLGPDEDLERGGLGVQELGAAGEQLLLGGVVGAGQRGLGADDVQQRHGVRRRPRPEAGDAALQRDQVEASLRGYGGHERRLHHRTGRSDAGSASGLVLTGLDPVRVQRELGPARLLAR